CKELGGDRTSGGLVELCGDNMGLLAGGGFQESRSACVGIGGGLGAIEVENGAGVLDAQDVLGEQPHAALVVHVDPVRVRGPVAREHHQWHPSRGSGEDGVVDCLGKNCQGIDSSGDVIECNALTHVSSGGNHERVSGVPGRVLGSLDELVEVQVAGRGSGGVPAIVDELDACRGGRLREGLGWALGLSGEQQAQHLGATASQSTSACAGNVSQCVY